MLDLNGAMKEVEKEKVHTFEVRQGNQVGQVKVPHSGMKCCPCGCSRFVQQFHVGLMKPPVLGAPPVSVQVPLFVCAECGSELRPSSPTVAEVESKSNESLKADQAFQEKEGG